MVRWRVRQWWLIDEEFVFIFSYVLLWGQIVLFQAFVRRHRLHIWPPLDPSLPSVGQRVPCTRVYLCAGKISIAWPSRWRHWGVLQLEETCRIWQPSPVISAASARGTGVANRLYHAQLSVKEAGRVDNAVAFPWNTCYHLKCSLSCLRFIPWCNADYRLWRSVHWRIACQIQRFRVRI